MNAISTVLFRKVSLKIPGTPALILSLTIMSSLLSACTSLTPGVVSTQTNSAAIQDKLFPTDSSKPVATNIFDLNDEMLNFIKTDIINEGDKRLLQNKLFSAIQNRSQLKLEYDSFATKNATQTFTSRSGNCLSLVIMTAAFARQLGLEVHFQNVEIDETWNRKDNLYFATGHVNIVLGPRHQEVHFKNIPVENLTIDFYPSVDINALRSKEISEKRVIAMYMNNRAAELLSQNDLNQAYRYARMAILTDPNFFSAYNTLAVIYQNHNNFPEAEIVLRTALASNPNNISALSNLINLLKQQNRLSEVATLQTQLDYYQPLQPFYYLNLGKQALDKNQTQLAIQHLKKELERDPYYHETHFYLALAYYQSGKLNSAKEYMGNAKEQSNTKQLQNIYSAKLERLKSMAIH